VGERTQLLLRCYDMSKWLKGIASPVLVIHGMLDDTLTIQDGRVVAQALRPQAELLELPGIGHNDLPLFPAAQDAMRAFIGQHAQRTTG
jgi:pimeloyl-ACP methyl ester carboxylesterase